MYGCNKPFWPLPYAKAYSLELDWILEELRKVQEGGGTPLESLIKSIDDIKSELASIVAAPGIVYDTQKLGGVAADQYALKTDTAPDSLKLGGVVADQYALKTDTAPDSLKLGGVAAANYALKTDTAPDSLKLGGVAAANYALKTDTAPNSLQLGGKPGSEYASAESLLQLKGDIEKVKGVPAGGAAGQVLAKNTGGDNDTIWIDPPSGIPSGGAAGQVLAKKTSANDDTEWIDPPSGSGMKMELVWNNASPASAFVAQTVSVPNVTDYPFIFVSYDTYAGNNKRKNEFLKTDTGCLFYFSYSGIDMHRDVSIVSGGVKFENAVNTTSGNSVDNNYLVPISIYVITGAL